jgi:hypothetical protein
MGSLVLLGSGAASASVSCETDFNGDGVTNETDFEILKSQMGATDDQEGYSPAVDLDGDGQVGLSDLNVFLNCN